MISYNNTDAETTGFIETPTSVTAAVGGTAVFRCRHTGADVIGWTVNGASFGSLRSLNITAGSQPLAGGSVLHTLTIQALAAYNNTNVACIATSFESGSARESTPDATLLIQGEGGQQWPCNYASARGGQFVVDYCM